MKTSQRILLNIFVSLLLAIAPATRAQFGVSFSTAVDTNIAIPGGTGNFTDFPAAPGISEAAAPTGNALVEVYALD